MASPIRSHSPIEAFPPLLKFNYNTLQDAATQQNEETKNYLLNVRVSAAKVSEACTKMRQDVLSWTDTYNSLPIEIRLLLPSATPSPTYVLDIYYTTIPINLENFKKKPFKSPYDNKYYSCASEWCSYNGFTDTVYDAKTLKLLGFYDLVVKHTDYLSIIETRFLKSNFHAYANQKEHYTHRDFVIFKNEIFIQFFPNGKAV